MLGFLFKLIILLNKIVLPGKRNPCDNEQSEIQTIQNPTYNNKGLHCKME